MKVRDFINMDKLSKIIIAILGSMLLIFSGGIAYKLFFNDVVSLSDVRECQEYYNQVGGEYWDKEQEGRLQIIYNPSIRSCLAANFYNENLEDGASRSFGMIVDLNRGKTLTSYIYESKGPLVKAGGCSEAYASLERINLFGKKKTEICDNRKDFLAEWTKEARRYGFSRWE